MVPGYQNSRDQLTSLVHHFSATRPPYERAPTTAASSCLECLPSRTAGGLWSVHTIHRCRLMLTLFRGYDWFHPLVHVTLYAVTQLLFSNVLSIKNKLARLTFYFITDFLAFSNSWLYSSQSWFCPLIHVISYNMWPNFNFKSQIVHHLTWWEMVQLSITIGNGATFNHVQQSLRYWYQHRDNVILGGKCCWVNDVTSWKILWVQLLL